MRKLWYIFFKCFLIVCAGIVASSVAADEHVEGKTTHITLGAGWETLNYREREPDTPLASEGDASNWTIGVDASKRWEHFFCGVKGIVPVYLNADREEWSVFGILTQQNELAYEWSRVDAYLGYPYTPFFNPYVGLRWSEANQKRTEFFFLGTPIEGNVTETVTAWFFTLGVKGTFLLNPRWRFSYSGSYFEPVSSDVENSRLPGLDVTDIGGYAYDFEGQLEYGYTASVSFAFRIYGGKMHCNGSDWMAYSGKFVKWPENDTRYLGGMLNVKWSF